MSVRAISKGFLYRFLQRTSTVPAKADADRIWEVVDVAIPHPELNLDDFWAFRGATE